MRWVKRNEDKPHRCPECHAVATWEHDKAGPRTILKCPRECGVQWRYGRRWKKYGMRRDRLINGVRLDKLYWFTISRFGHLTETKK